MWPHLYIKCTAITLCYGITNDKIPFDVRHHLGADVVLADGEMDTSHRNAMFATRDFVEHGDVMQFNVCCYSGSVVPYLQYLPVPQLFVSICVLMTHVH